MDILALSITAIAIYLILGLVSFILWILTLIHSIKRGRIAWFVLILIIPIVYIFYWITWIFSSKFRRKRR